jgi:hypothetical protein
MMLRFQCASFLILSLLPSGALAEQEIAYLNLVEVTPRTHLRLPDPPPPVCKEDGTCSVTGGGVTGMVGDGFEARNEPRALKTTLLSLDRVDYAADDQAEMEIIVENVGSVDMTIPLCPHLADLQPANKDEKFEYRSMAIVFTLADNADERQHQAIVVAKLFSTVERPDTQKVLKQGESIRLRLKTKLVEDPDTLQAGHNYTVNVVPHLCMEAYIPKVGSGGYTMSTINEYPRHSSGPDWTIRIVQGQDASKEH